MILKCLYGNVTVKVWDLMVLEMAYSLWRTQTAVVRSSSLTGSGHLLGPLGSLAWFLACLSWSWSCGHLICGEGLSMPLSAVGDSIWLLDESAMTSAGFEP